MTAFSLLGRDGGWNDSVEEHGKILRRGAALLAAMMAEPEIFLDLVKADVLMFPSASLPQALHDKYGSDINMQSMVVKPGENSLADYVVFNIGDAPKRNYPVSMILEGGIIDQPQEMSDVRGAVTSDYQDVLEQQWKEELLKKYPVKINKKVLKKVKK